MPAIPRRWVRERSSYYHLSKREQRQARTAVAGRVLLACLALATALSIVLVFQKQGKPAEESAAPVASSFNTAEPFVDGQIQFVVQEIRPLEAQTRSIHVVSVGLSNIGSSPQLVSFSDQRLLGDQGREFPPDPELLTQLNNGKVALLLPPGRAATIRIPFVLPVHTEPVAVALKAGAELPAVSLPPQ